MISQFLLNIMFVAYVIAGIGLVAYGFNCYASIYLFLKNSRKVRLDDRKAILQFYRTHTMDSMPMVTTQLPIYNEANCVERLIEAICAIDYPKEKHEIQVLDDSTDECLEVTTRKVKEMQAKGYNIVLIPRTDRKEFKAGALKAGLAIAKGDFISIFDADFVPEKDFLLKTIPYMVMDSKVGLVQGRWGHLNRNESGLTLAQSIGIDGHFVIEQSARSWGKLFMNFNGTAGVWRKQAILDAGNWQGDTLTEDMDLSYRSQLAGWRMKFVFDVIVPAELPNDINAYKAQQFRWAKGSIQTAIKILPKVLKAKVPLRVKIGAFMHTTHYSIHPCMLFTALFAFPLLAFYEPVKNMPTWAFIVGFAFIFLAAVAPSVLYFVAQRSSGYSGWRVRMLSLPVLMSLGVGIAVSNTRAVLSAIFSRKGGVFVRTPKKGAKKLSIYSQKFPFEAVLEIVVGLYCFFGLLEYIGAQKFIIGPFLALYAVGFLSVGVLSLMHYISSILEAYRYSKSEAAAEESSIA
ncbi:MAG: glycosyltransferase [Fibrobacter sp.]|jgi:cellulose synthase/poly-beta-1,6-N-acetylglucosamine synthase-like glycosyltransferase|nr:glycosyltransferase [Fibrobacter sp.]